MSSVYLWDLEHGFAGVILIKKAGDGSKKIKGCWDSIHVVEVQVCICVCTYMHTVMYECKIHAHIILLDFLRGKQAVWNSVQD